MTETTVNRKDDIVRCSVPEDETTDDVVRTTEFTEYRAPSSPP